MKSITYEVTERVRVWYQTTVCVTEEDVRRSILSEMQDIQASKRLSDVEKARAIAECQQELEDFIDDRYHEAWSAVAIEKFQRPAESVEEDHEETETEPIESAGWDGEEDGEREGEREGDGDGAQ